MTVDEFLLCLKKSRLLNEKQQVVVRRSVESAKKPQSAESISGKLVRQELLTEWQARMLLQKQTGFVLGQYRLQMPIGKGGMGKVFKAWDAKLDRVVAIKVLAKKFAKNEKLVARFRREIELASKLDSPWIVRTIDAGEIGQSHFMVMEYVDGEGLDSLGERLGRVRPDHACELIRQAALGLQFAHEQGMVHRDIKPANLIVSFENGGPMVRLLDMGLARLEAMDNDGMTRTGQVMGTPDFMAPEQGWNTADVDIRADIYSLGCTMFRLVTGSVPFPGDNPLQVLMARCSTDAPLGSSIVPDLDSRVDSVLRGMTWRDPSRRYQTPGEVAAALAPLASVPTRVDFEGGIHVPAPAEAATVIQDATQAEPSFQEFLREMDSGSRVTLFDATDDQIQPGESRTTGIDHRPAAKPNRRRGNPWPLIITPLVIAAVAAGGFALSQNGDPEPSPTKKQPDSASTNKVQPRYFADVPVQRVEAGQVVNFFAAPDVVSGLKGVTWVVAEGKPDGATLDAETGEFYWIPPRTVKPGRLTLKLQAKRNDKVQAEQQVFIDIRVAPLNARIVEFENEVATVGQEWTYQLKLFGPDASSGQFGYRLAGTPPEGLTLDSETGLLAWTPLPAHQGRRPLSVELVDPNDDRVIHSASASVFVRPLPRVITLPSTSVEAGKEIVIDLQSTGGRRLPQGVGLQLTPEGRALGAAVDAGTTRFRWTPERDRRGETVFQVQLRRRGVVMGLASFAIVVTAPVSTIAEPTLPPESEVTAAEAEIRELFKRDFAQRSSSSRRELAGKLLVRSFGENTDAMRYALLKLAMEVAADGRAFATGLETALELSDRFGVDSVASSLTALEGFRTRGTTPADKAIVVEAAFRESLRAAESNRFQAVETLIRAADTVARIERSGSLTDSIRSVQTVLESLPTDVETATDLDQSQQLAKDELIATLAKLRFTPLFQNTASVRFVQNNALDPASARDLWTIEDGHIRMSGPSSDGVTGFVDPGLTLSSFVVRLWVSGESTTGMLILGSPVTGQVSGYQIPLAGAELLQVRQSNLAQPLAMPKGRLVRDKSGWDLVEVQVAGQQVIVSLNGNRVTEAQLPAAPDGSAGILAVLRGAGDQSFAARRVRVLDTTAP